MDVPCQDGGPAPSRPKICVVTGGTDGIGLAIARGLVSLGHHVVIVARNPLKGQLVAASLNQLAFSHSPASIVPESSLHAPAPQMSTYMAPPAVFFQADLSLLAETRRVAAEILAFYPSIDLLINNAGTFSPTRRETPEGFELTFALNYLSPFLLTHLLLSALSASPQARVLNMASVDHKLAKIRFDDLQSHAYPLGTRAYGQSKLALVMFTQALAHQLRHTQITVNAIHPGIIPTNITHHTPGFEGFITKLLVRLVGTPLDVAVTQILRIALSPIYRHVSGAYFSKGRIARPSRRARKEADICKLWAVTLQMVGLASFG